MTQINSTEGPFVCALLTTRIGKTYNDQVVVVDQMEAIRLKMIYGDDFFDLEDLLNDHAPTPPKPKSKRKVSGKEKVS